MENTEPRKPKRLDNATKLSIVETYKQGEFSQRQIAERFRINHHRSNVG